MQPLYEVAVVEDSLCLEEHLHGARDVGYHDRHAGRTGSTQRRTSAAYVDMAWKRAERGTIPGSNVHDRRSLCGPSPRHRINQVPVVAS